MIYWFYLLRWFSSELKFGFDQINNESWPCVEVNCKAQHSCNKLLVDNQRGLQSTCQAIIQLSYQLIASMDLCCPSVGPRRLHLIVALVVGIYGPHFHFINTPLFLHPWLLTIRWHLEVELSWKAHCGFVFGNTIVLHNIDLHIDIHTFSIPHN